MRILKKIKGITREAMLARKHSQPESQYILETRLPRVGDYTPRYDIPDGVLVLYKDIEKISAKVLSKITCNHLNEKYMDQLIGTLCKIGITNGLENQKTLHKRVILSMREELHYQRNMLTKELDCYRKAYEENQKEMMKQ